MNKWGRVISAILVVLAVTSSLMAFRYLLLNRSIYQRLLETEDLLSQETEEKESLSKELASVKQELKLAKEKRDATESELRKCQEDYKNFRVNYELAVREKENLASQIQKLAQEKLTLENKVSEMEKDAFLAKLLKDKSQAELLTQRVSEELVIEKREKDGFLDELKKVGAERDSLQEELDRISLSKRSLETELISLNKRLDMGGREKEGLDRQVRDLERKVQLGSDEIGRLKAALEEGVGESKRAAAPEAEVVELPPIIVKAESLTGASEKTRSSKIFIPTPGAPTSKVEYPLRPKTSIEGNVISISEENNFVVIDLGEEDGLKLGMSLKVYQGAEKIGEVEVIEMRRGIAACDIKDIKERREIMVGDAVK